MTVRTRVVLWTDYVSPYAFVAKAWAYQLEADYEIDLEWRPYTLDIASFQGSVEQRDPHHWRRVRYAYMDARRFANKQGLVLMGPKKIYYARTINAGMLYAQQHGVFRAYNDLAFDRFWRRDLDPESVEAVSAARERAGAYRPGAAVHSAYRWRHRPVFREPALRGPALSDPEYRRPVFRKPPADRPHRPTEALRTAAAAAVRAAERQDAAENLAPTTGDRVASCGPRRAAAVADR